MASDDQADTCRRGRGDRGAHSHGAHDHHGHAHTANETRVGIVALATGAFMLVEVAGGLISGSLALIADAGHMLTDFASLTLAWFGFRLARKPADWKRTYGFDRFSVLVAFVNGLALFVIAGWIVWEAWQRFNAPQEIMGGIMMVVAVAGLVVNLFGFWVLSGGDRDNLNMRAAALHVMGDLLGSVAAIGAAVVILATGWTPIDPILSVAVALIILRSATLVVRESAHILLEGAPQGLDTREISDDLRQAFDAVEDVHHVHAWSITQERPMVTLHARVSEGVDTPMIVRDIKARLRARFSIDHVTVEIEIGRCADDDAS